MRLFFLFLLCCIRISLPTSLYFRSLRSGVHDKAVKTEDYDPLSQPGGRRGGDCWEPGAIPDPEEGVIYMFGGFGVSTTYDGCDMNDVWAFHISSGEYKQVTGRSVCGISESVYSAAYEDDNFPGGRSFVSAVSINDEERIFFFGYGYGMDADPSLPSELNDVWMFNSQSSRFKFVAGEEDPSTIVPHWSPEYDSNVTTVVAARKGACAWYVESASTAVLFGGATSTGVMSDLFYYDVVDYKFKHVVGSTSENTPGDYTSNKLPGARWLATTWAVGNELFMWGGKGYGDSAANGWLNDLWKITYGEPPVFEVVIDSRSIDQQSGALPGGAENAMFVTVGSLGILFGGVNDNGLVDETWVMEGTTLTKIESNFPDDLSQAFSTASSDTIVVFGGIDKDDEFYNKVTYAIDVIDYSCGSKLKHDVAVCGGRGSCDASESCTCNDGYFEPLCSVWSCHGVKSNDDACSGNGDCDEDTFECECDTGYYGPECNVWKCNDVFSNSSLVCNGIGVCNEDGTCSCAKYHEGEDCKEEKEISGSSSVGEIMTVAGPLIGVVVIVGVIAAILLVVVIVLIILMFMKKGSGGKKRESYREEGIVLEEKQEDSPVAPAENDTANPLFGINVDLANRAIFSINAAELTILESYQGSSSIVFKVNWNGGTYSYKRFNLENFVTNVQKDPLERLEKEINFLFAINHPGVLKCHGGVLKMPNVGVVLDYCEYGNIKAFLSIYKSRHGSHFPFKERVRLLLQICSAQAYFEVDKPEIIQSSFTHESVLINYLLDPKFKEFILNGLLNDTAPVVSSKYYVSPEVVKGGEASHISTVYSFAILMYEVLSNRFNPFGEDFIEWKVSSDPKYRPDLSLLKGIEDYDFFAQLLERMWDAEIDRRYSFIEIEQLIHGVLHPNSDQMKNISWPICEAKQSIKVKVQRKNQPESEVTLIPDSLERVESTIAMSLGMKPLSMYYFKVEDELFPDMFEGEGAMIKKTFITNDEEANELKAGMVIYVEDALEIQRRNVKLQNAYEQLEGFTRELMAKNEIAADIPTYISNSDEEKEQMRTRERMDSQTDSTHSAELRALSGKDVGVNSGYASVIPDVDVVVSSPADYHDLKPKYEKQVDVPTTASSTTKQPQPQPQPSEEPTFPPQRAPVFSEGIPMDEDFQPNEPDDFDADVDAILQGSIEDSISKQLEEIDKAFPTVGFEKTETTNSPPTHQSHQFSMEVERGDGKEPTPEETSEQSSLHQREDYGEHDETNQLLSSLRDIDGEVNVENLVSQLTNFDDLEEQAEEAEKMRQEEEERTKEREKEELVGRLEEEAKQQRIEEEKRRQEEQEEFLRKQAKEQKTIEEEEKARIENENRLAEEKRRKAEEETKRRKEEEERKKEALAMKMSKKQKKKEEKRKKEEERKRKKEEEKKKKMEAKRLKAEEKRKKDEEKRKAKKKKGESDKKKKGGGSLKSVIKPGRQVRITLVGDGAVGKTSLLYVFKENVFPEDYLPTVFDNHQKDFDVEVEGEKFSFDLFLCDTAGQEDYDELRKLSYENIDIFIICFNVADGASYRNVRNKWLKEIVEFVKPHQAILVGTKTDLRNDPQTLRQLQEDGEKMKEFGDGVAMAKKVKASAYLEICAKEKIGINEVFTKAVHVFLQNELNGV